MTDNNNLESLTNEEINYDPAFLLERAYNAFKVVKEKNKFPKIAYEKLNRKVYITNFLAICKAMNRDPEDVKNYLEKKLKYSESSEKITVSIKENGYLKIDDNIKSGIIENIMTDYIMTYIMCKSCKSCKTTIMKDNRISYIICETCRCKRAIS
jgi:translation initiation factor 2 subunit 2